jgi:hypothetical protein
LRSYTRHTDLPLNVCKNVWTTAQLVVNQVLLCNGGNNYKLPHFGKLKIAAANGRAIPMRLPCRALIASDHLNADAITAAIVSSDQGMPARLFLILRFLSMHLFDCCVSSAVAHRNAIPPLPLLQPPCIDCVHRTATHLPLSYRGAVVHRDRATVVHLTSTATTTGDHQNVTEALLGLFQEGTPNDESLIVGLDSLSIGDTDDNSMEDPLADGDAADGNATDGDAADGNMEDGEAAMNGLRQMGQRLQFDILESFFDDFAGDIEWGGEDYNDTCLFDESGLAEGSHTGSTNESGIAAGQEAADEEEEYTEGSCHNLLYSQ